MLCLGCSAPVPQASNHQVSSTDVATVTDVHFPSRNIGGLLWYRIIVPTVKNGERLPVLYLLHGANSNPAEIQQLSDVVNLAASSRLIVVMPQAETSYYTNARYHLHARWEGAITEELPKNVEAGFPALTSRDHRGIAGISMGGYGAVKLALKHQELYSFAGTISGALDITRRPTSIRRWAQTSRIWSIFGVRAGTRRGEDVFALLDGAKDLRNITWFSSCGKADPLYPINSYFIRRLRERGIPVNSISIPGGHDWQSWNTSLPSLFKVAAERLR